MRAVEKIYKVQPLQIDTVELVPNCAIQGEIGSIANVIGTTLNGKITLVKNTLPLQDGNYEIVVVAVGAVGVGSYKVVNADTGFESATVLSSATANTGLVAGVSITVSDTSGETIGNKVAFSVTGDQTYIIPGTTLGKLASGNYLGKWRPIRSTDVLTDFTQFRVCSGFQETDKNKTVLPAGYESNLSSVFTMDVVVYGQIYESVCNKINLTAVEGLKAKIPFYAWL